MPTLGEYVGQLMAEITQARVQADVEATRIAELYASDPLLKYMPVPRFRLPTLTLDVPVAVNSASVPDGTLPESGTGEGVDPADILPAFDRVFPAQLDAARLTLSIDGREKARQYVLEFARYTKPGMAPADVAREVTSIITEVIYELARSEGAPDGAVEAFLPAFQGALQRELQAPSGALARVDVNVTTSQLREVGSPDLLVRLRLSVSEESMEWSVTPNPDGTTTSRLVPA